jgi:hypothetical protein
VERKGRRGSRGRPRRLTHPPVAAAPRPGRATIDHSGHDSTPPVTMRRDLTSASSIPSAPSPATRHPLVTAAPRRCSSPVLAPASHLARSISSPGRRPSLRRPATSPDPLLPLDAARRRRKLYLHSWTLLPPPPVDAAGSLPILTSVNCNALGHRGATAGT